MARERIPQTTIDHLLASVNLVELINQSIRLIKQTDTQFKGDCPFHKGTGQTLVVEGNEQRFHCIDEKCGFTGSAIGWMMYYNGLTFTEAVHDLSAMSGIDVTRWINSKDIEEKTAKQLDLLSSVGEYFHQRLLESNEDLAYLHSRGVSLETINTFQLGVASNDSDGSLINDALPKKTRELWAAGVLIRRSDKSYYPRFRNRIMFPIRDEHGNVRGFGARTVIADSIKYLNSTTSRRFNKSRLLYGLRESLNTYPDSESVILVEGYMDVVALFQAGFTNAVGTMGTALTEAHLEEAFKHYQEIILCFDGDDAGKRATLQSIATAYRAIRDGKRVSFVLLDSGMDPDDYLQKYSPEEFQLLLDNRLEISETLITLLCKDLDLNSIGGLARLFHLTDPYIKSTGSIDEKQRLIEKVEEVLGVSLEQWV